MRINIETMQGLLPVDEVRVGNVYSARGGRAASLGHMYVVVSITEVNYPDVIMLICNKEGEIVGSTKYGMHYVSNLSPIAFVEGLDDLQLNMRPL